MFEAIHGLRSLLHIGVIALHVRSAADLHIHYHTSFFDYFKMNSLLGRAMLLGGMHVDGFYVMSGFLHVMSAIEAEIESKDAFTWFKNDILKRYIRFAVMNTLLVVFIMCFTLDYKYFNQEKSLKSMVYNALLLKNYDLDLLTLSQGPMWSTHADFQCSCLISAMLSFSFWLFDTKSTSRQISISFLLILFSLLSLIVRYVRFDLVDNNFLASAFRINFISSFPCDSVRAQFQEAYGYQIDPQEPCFPEIRATFENLYYSTITRFSAFGVGGILAIIIHRIKSNNQNGDEETKYSTTQYVLSRILLIIGVGHFIILVQPPELPPKEAQLAINVAIHLIHAIAFGILLLCSCTPSSHPLFFKPLHDILSLGIWKQIANVSYPSYAFHFIVMLNMVFTYDTPSFDVNKISQENPELALKLFNGYLLKVTVKICVISLLIGTLLNRFYEQPVLSYLQRLLHLETKSRKSLKAE